MLAALQVLPRNHRKSLYAFRIWPDKVQALVTYDTMRLNDPSLPWTVRNGRYMPTGLHTPRLTVVAVKVVTSHAAVRGLALRCC